MFKHTAARRMFSPAIHFAGDDGGSGGGEKPITREEIAKLVNDTVTGATKNWGERFAKSINEDVGKRFDAIGEQLSKLAPAANPPPKAGDNPALPDDVARRLAKAEEDAKLATEQVKKLAESNRLKDEALADRTFRSTLRDALTKAGVKPTLLPAAMALHRESGKFKVDGDKLLATVKRVGYEDQVEAEEAIAEWVTTDEGKQFLPPVDAGGGGDTSRASASSQATPQSRGIFDKNPNVAVANAFSILGQPAR